MKKNVPAEGEGVCSICGKPAGKDDLFDMGDGFHCSECLGGRFDPVKEIKAYNEADLDYGGIRPEEGDGSVYANVFFFFLIGLPTAASFFGLPNFFLGFLALVHEMGHFVVMLADMFLPGDNWFLVVLAGSLSEILVPLLSFLYLYPHRKVFVVSCLFLSASGLALMDTGRYMSSAGNPSGYAYISGHPVTYQNHDWYLIFAQLDILDLSRELSEVFFAAGGVLMYVGFYTSLAAFYAAGSRRRQSGFFLFGTGLGGVHALLCGEQGLALMLAGLGIFLLAYLKLTRE